MVELARLDAAGFTRLEELRVSGRPRAGMPRLMAIGSRRTGFSSWQGPLLLGSVFGFPEPNPTPVVLARAKHRDLATYQLTNGELHAGLLGLVEDDHIVWSTTAGNAVATNELACFLLLHTTIGANQGESPIVSRQLASTLSPVAITVKDPRPNTEFDRLLVGPMFVDVEPFAARDRVKFRVTSPGWEIRYCPGFSDVELATYSRFREEGMSEAQAEQAVRLITV